MTLTRHQRLHLDGIVLDATRDRDSDEKTRVLNEANDLIDGVTEWPTTRILLPSQIHDWIEKPERRSYLGRVP